MLRARRDLSSLLAGDDAFLPLPDLDSNEARRLSEHLGVGDPIDDRVSLVVSTSGTTGVPKGAMHTADTLRASADATADALGGPGAWLATLPPHHIAGLQVILRSLAAGHEPVVVDLTSGFDPAVLAPAVDALGGSRGYTSLVPVQLRKALELPTATAALARLDGILVGGAATPAVLQRQAVDAGLTIVRTYGMSETAGGCVYDGVPLRGVDVRIDDPDHDGVGRVVLGGATVALGYRNLPDHEAFAETGWFRTDDLGAVDDGVLRIVGRADEAISSGGLTVIPQVVEAVIGDLPSVADCAVVGLADERLGERVVTAVVAAPDTAAPTLDEIRGWVTERLDGYAAPREVYVLDTLPRRGPGKVDRRRLRELLG